MTTTFAAALNERYRSAMLALYLHEAVPNDPYLIAQGLATQIKTPNDLYEYWLLDVLVSQNVPTSPVACAIASLQQLVNSMMLNMEPGYSDDSLTPQQIKTWQNGLNRYPVWAAIQQLHYFPDIYLDPSLRLNKTDNFKQLESDLNQAQIQPETVQAALLAYLARFEEVANLKICNGYIDGENFANSTYYFIAKSPAENAWYWRSLDMSQRPVREPARTVADIPHKYDKPLPNAWTDWQKANVPISEKALEHTVRPCWFNNRLFVIWAEVELQDEEATADETRADPSVKVNPRFRLYASYKKYDDSWSTPRVYIESYCKTLEAGKTPEQFMQETQTIAVYDHSTSPESMFIALYSNYHAGDSQTGDKDSYDFLRTRRIDKNFNVAELYPLMGFVHHAPKQQEALNTVAEDPAAAHVQSVGRLFANINAGRFQYWLPTGTPHFGNIERPEKYPATAFWNFEQLQQNIKDSRKDQEFFYDRDNANVRLIVKQESEFPATLRTTIAFLIKNVPIIELTLIYPEKEAGLKYATLLEGSEIKASSTDLMDIEGGKFSILLISRIKESLITDPGDGLTFSVPRTAITETTSLTGKLIYNLLLEYFYERKYPFKLKRLTPNAAAQQFDGYTYFQGRVGYEQVIMRPSDVISPDLPATYFDTVPLYRSSIVNSLPRDSTFAHVFSIDQTTLQPDGWDVEWPDKEDIKIPLIYGVRVHHSHRIFGWINQGGALKALKLTWGETLVPTQQIAPTINNYESQSLGTAQFIDFAGSSIRYTDADASVGWRAPIRMNTVFARALINLAESGMEALLSYATQTARMEPPISDGLGPQPMDFSGAYSTQFCELFLYTFWLVAHRLNQEQQYDEARRCLSFLFDPSRQSGDAGHPVTGNQCHWKSRYGQPRQTPARLFCTRTTRFRSP
ncbi:neuraminidase-like domain-containing protein [Pseudomonas sp. SWRI81]|uniref:neuraminidase-like domain-containing protein n=1 Tax=Pseudomonas sp. SWRI81 TaxID=2745505 RepID=UPI001EE2FF61|nr:neuraminidase-like domain-containing protein [Pseudomonas sp. SWRI81]